jgi:hypothetical protein
MTEMMKCRNQAEEGAYHIEEILELNIRAISVTVQ